MIQVGDIVRTSYGTGPYRVDEIIRGCTCPKFTDELRLGDDAPPSAPHIHLLLADLRRGREHDGPSMLAGYDEDTLKSVWGDRDSLEIIGRAAVQLPLFGAAGQEL